MGVVEAESGGLLRETLSGEKKQNQKNQKTREQVLVPANFIEVSPGSSTGIQNSVLELTETCS